MEKILIVEDDRNIARMIEAALSIGGYNHEICPDGDLAVRMITENDYSLILLDVMLPGTDGFGVIRKIEKRGIPVIFLTALQDISDKVKGLKLGAEDYIVKPFEAVELLARIEVVLRRFKKSCSALSYGGITVDMERYTVTRDGAPVSLTPKEFSMLTFFMRNIDIALTRERILSGVWGYTFQGESRTVDIHIQQIRKKLGLHDMLVTIPKLGYRLNRFIPDTGCERRVEFD